MTKTADFNGGVQSEPRLDGPARLTLDTNCLVDVAESRPDATHVLELVRLHRQGVVRLSVTGVSAAEARPGGGYIRNVSAYLEFLAEIGLSDLPLLKPIGVVGLTYLDWYLAGDEASEVMRGAIRSVLFPDLPPYAAYCEMSGLDPTAEMEPKYRNKELDVMHLWTHILHKGDAFVTRDRNFHRASKRQALKLLGAKRIMAPPEAVMFARAEARP
jgi:predicted nucleic acid-binding protein